MKSLNIYQQIQLVILAVFLFLFVVTATMMVSMTTPPETIKTLFGELKNLFLTLLSIKGLSEAISRNNGGKANEKVSPAADSVAP